MMTPNYKLSIDIDEHIDVDKEVGAEIHIDKAVNIDALVDAGVVRDAKFESDFKIDGSFNTIPAPIPYYFLELSCILKKLETGYNNYRKKLSRRK
jgi:hypothetical protein